MDLPNIKDLEKLLKMCRKQGITELNMAGMSFKFGELPREYAADEQQVPEEVTEIDMAYYSALPMGDQ